MRQPTNAKDITKIETFIHLQTYRVGQLAHLSSPAGNKGVSATALGGWLFEIEASFVAVRLHFYHKNIGKRLAERPKRYFTRTGLLTWMLLVDIPEQVCGRRHLRAHEALKAACSRRVSPEHSLDKY